MSKKLLGEVIEKVEASDAVDHKAKFLYLIMAHKAKGRIYDGQRVESIRFMGLTPRPVDRTISNLVKAGWIKRTRGKIVTTELLF